MFQYNLDNPVNIETNIIKYAVNLLNPTDVDNNGNDLF